MKSVFIAITLILLASQNASANVCEALQSTQQMEQQFCARNERDGLYRQRFADGTFLPNPALFANQLRAQKANVNPDVQHRRRIGQALAKLIESMVLQVSGGRAESDLNLHQRYIINRLRTLTVRYENFDHCDQELNADYTAGPNAIRLCPIFSYLPAEVAVAVVAHELGHLADPCLYTTDEPIPENKRLPVRRARAGQDAMVNTCFLRGCATEPVVRPETYEGHPYINSAICVNENYPNTQGLDSETRAKVIQDYGELFDTPVPVQPTDFVDRRGASCSRQVSEAFADSVQASLLQFHLEQNPNAIPAERRMLLVYSHEGDFCAAGDNPNPDYPRYTDRLRNILQIPALRNQLGCELSEVRPVCRLENSSRSISTPRTDMPDYVRGASPALGR